MEKVRLRDVHNRAKIVGTLVCVGGAMLLLVYKGPILSHVMGNKQFTSTNVDDKDWIKGSLMLLATCLCFTTFSILQTKIVKKYETPLSITTLICLVGAIESTEVTFIFIRDLSIWTLKWNINLVAVIYIGVLSSGMAYYLQGYAMGLKGIEFANAFYPLKLIIVAFMGSLILGEILHLGSVVGGVVIVVGLYAMLWGKSKDNKISREIETQRHDSQLQDPKGKNKDLEGLHIDVENECSSSQEIKAQ